MKKKIVGNLDNRHLLEPEITYHNINIIEFYLFYLNLCGTGTITGRLTSFTCCIL